MWGTVLYRESSLSCFGVWSGNDLEMTVFMGSSAQKGGKWHETENKGPFGEALFLTTSHVLVLVTKNVCL